MHQSNSKSADHHAGENCLHQRHTYLSYEPRYGSNCSLNSHVWSPQTATLLGQDLHSERGPSGAVGEENEGKLTAAIIAEAPPSDNNVFQFLFVEIFGFLGR